MVSSNEYHPSTEPDGYDDKMDDSCAMVSPELGSLIFDYDYPLGKSITVKTKCRTRGGRANVRNHPF